jgi:hypothetical protein
VELKREEMSDREGNERAGRGGKKRRILIYKIFDYFKQQKIKISLQIYQVRSCHPNLKKANTPWPLNP